jgi:flagellar basal body-associated protein FliL
MKTIFAMVGNNEKAMRSIILRYTNSKDTAKNIWTGRRGKGATKGVRDYFRQYHQQQLQQNAGAIELIETIKQQLSA